jgi:superfamily II DNA or RNA helicase
MPIAPHGAVPRGPTSEARPVHRVASATSCVPHVRLFADEVTVHRAVGLGDSYETENAPLIELSFDYPGGRVRASEAFAPYGVVRDERAEHEARRMLETFGAVDLDCLDTHAVSPNVSADYVVRCDGSVHDFCAFAAYVVPQLRALGWVVSIDEDYSFKVVEAEAPWYANLEKDEERPDWFGLELGIEIDGQRVNLVPALVELLEQCNSKDKLGDILRRAPKCLAVPVGEKLYVPVPTARVRGILRIISELYEGTLGQDPILRMPELKCHSLDRLEELFEGEGEGLKFTGAPRPHRHDLDDEVELTPPTGLRAELRPYQKDGVAFLQRLRRAGRGGILADDMGLGKTLQTIAHITMEKEGGRLDKPFLIVSPTSLVFNWEREIHKFSPGLKVVALRGARRRERFSEVTGADVVVTSYPCIIRDEEDYANWQFHSLVLDEAQTVKNAGSRAHRAVRAIQADHKLCLSGTPIENHLGELFALADLSNPGLLGDELHFSRFFRVPIEKHRDTERLAALRDAISPYILRRHKSDVAKDLPPKTELFRPVDLTGRQRELYESIRVAAHAEVRRLVRKKGLAASTIPILTALTKLRQVCCDPRLSAVGKGVRESAKYDLFFELLGKQLEGGHRVLVFSQFTSMLSLLARGLDERKIPWVALTGATADRRAVVDRFERGDAPVFLISLKAGGTGLTLTSADTVIHYDPWWNPAAQAQATDRAYRIGQQKPVFVYNLFAAGSVEERILRLQKRKRDVATAILEARADLGSLDEHDLDVLFAPLG